MDKSKRKTEKARWSMPRGWVVLKMCDDFLEAEPMTLSVLFRTRTVSRSMNWDWDMVASHFVTSDSAVVDMLDW